MNILIASVFSYNSYSRGIMPDVLQTQIDKNPGANIYYLTNSNSFDICYFNIEKRPEVCYLCKTGVKNTLSLIEENFTHLKIKDLISPEDTITAQKYFESKKKISFDQVYEEFEVGAATLSTYISRTRDRELINVEKYYVKELAINALALYLATKRFLKEKNIDVVYNFNGRQDYVRAIMRASLALNINCFNVERARVGGYIETFKNTLSHDIQAKKDHVDLCWEQESWNDQEKIEIGSSFYTRQRGGESVIFPSYLKNQTKNYIPEEIQNGKDNVVLFNSSDDEFAALGDQFNNPIFKDQLEGISYLINLFGRQYPNTNFIIRMHPNLRNVNYKYVTDIKDQHQKYPNIFVIYPESDIDSYALMDLATTVITFGSTLGLEATFYKKPSILLGKCFYYYSNVAYTPVNTFELENLLKTKNLIPLPQINALKFGFYYLKGGEKSKYYNEVEVGENVYFKGEKIHSYNFFQLIFYAVIKYINKFTGIRIKI